MRAFDILISFDEWRDCVAGGKERLVNGAERSRWIRCIREICTAIFGKYILPYLGNIYYYIWEIFTTKRKCPIPYIYTFSWEYVCSVSLSIHFFGKYVHNKSEQ